MLHALRELTTLVEAHGSRSPQVRSSCALRILRSEMLRLELLPIEATRAELLGLLTAELAAIDGDR